MKSSKIFLQIILSFFILNNSFAHDLQDTKFRLRQFVDIVSSDGNDLAKDASSRFNDLIDEVCADLENPKNAEIRDEFIAACSPIFNIKSYKDHHKRELKDSLRKFDSKLDSLTGLDRLTGKGSNDLFDFMDIESKEFSARADLVAKIKELYSWLYIVLSEGKRLNGKKLDIFLDFIYYRPTHFVKEHKKEAVIAASFSLAVLISIYYIFYSNKSKADTSSAVSSENRSIKSLGLSEAVNKSLKAAGIYTIDDLMDRKKDDLSKIKGIGPASISKISSYFENLWKEDNPALAKRFEEINARGQREAGTEYDLHFRSDSQQSVEPRERSVCKYDLRPLKTS